MSEASTKIEKHIRLSAEHVDRLQRLSQARQMSEDQIIEKALELLFSLSEGSHERVERERWMMLSEPALRRVWDNEADARYDTWRDMYGSPTR